jgi:hypothetical protein
MSLTLGGGPTGGRLGFGATRYSAVRNPEPPQKTIGRLCPYAFSTNLRLRTSIRLEMREKMRATVCSDNSRGFVRPFVRLMACAEMTAPSPRMVEGGVDAGCLFGARRR